MNQLRISADRDLPISVITEKIAALGISGSGKSYGASKLVEELLYAGGQVVVVDTVGNWGPGLRLAADGKSPGIAIPILGGDHGDVVLDPSHGKLAAETVALTKSSLVLDVSDFTGGEMRKFVVPFATELLRLKKTHKSPVMIVWEECQDLVPQVAKGDVAFVLGAVTKLIKKGRNYGVGTLLITQRPAAVAKEVLNQCGTLFCFRQVGSHDRKAIRDWIVSKDLDVSALVDELPSLATGTCFCWSPEWLKTLQKIRIAKKRTFDSTATPEFGAKVKSGKLAVVDLDKFKATMSDAIAKAKANDPEEMRKRIVDLERTLASALKAKLPTAPKEKRIEVPFIPASQLAAIERVTNKVDTWTNRLHGMVEILEGLAKAKLAKMPALPRMLITDLPPGRPGGAIEVSFERTAAPRKDKGSGGDATIDGESKGIAAGERSVLTAVAQTAGGTTREQLTILTGYKPSTRNAYLQRLSAAGHVKQRHGLFFATEQGIEALGAGFEPLPTGKALREHWRQRLPEGERKVFEVLINAYPDPVERDAIGEATGYKPSTRNAYIQRLGTRKLLVVDRDGLRAAGDLFS